MRAMSVTLRWVFVISLMLACVLGGVCSAYAEETPVDAEALAGAAKSAVGELENVKVGAQGATVTVGGQEVGIDLGGITGRAQGGSNYVGMGMLLFGASVLTRLLSTIARIIRPRRTRERWIEA